MSLEGNPASEEKENDDDDDDDDRFKSQSTKRERGTTIQTRRAIFKGLSSVPDCLKLGGKLGGGVVRANET